MIRKTWLFVTVFAVLSGASVRAANFAYMTTNNQFGIVNLDTGAFAQLGQYVIRPISGLGEVGSGLYGGDETSGPTLFGVNPVNGAVTAIGAGSLAYDNLGSTANVLYAVDVNSQLFSIDPANGASTLIGPTGLVLPGFGLSSGGTILYLGLDSGSNSNLYSVNTATGAAALIGNTGIVIEAMVFENGTLFAASPSAIYTIDPTTGVATFLSTLSGTDGGVDGLAPLVSPEPPSFFLFLTGLVVSVIWLRIAPK
jgi:hypothetical protein